MNIVILAAGQGKRMNSNLPKVLHSLAGQPLLAHVLATVRQLIKIETSLAASRIVIVYGHGGKAVQAAFPDSDIVWALQEQQLGTGHALVCALPFLDPAMPTLVLPGDVPLVEVVTLQRLLKVAVQNDDLAILTVMLTDATGYGRIIRDAHGSVCRIVEHQDASEAERTAREINTGIMVLPTGHLSGWLDSLSKDNAQDEYYLTDVIKLAAAENLRIGSIAAQGEWEVLGVNSKSQLAQLERLWQSRYAQHLLDEGVTLADPNRIDVRGRLTCGNDVFIDINCLFIGDVSLGDGVRIGANCVLIDTHIGYGVQINAFSHLEKTEISDRCIIGPYARLRPGTALAAGAHIGNFVEIKNSRVGSDSKANHLAYIGDTDIGVRVNVGAGVITCNYDGAQKHRTSIGNDVFIGSDVQLVAPLTISDGVTIGAGTTVTQDVAENALVLSRVPQTIKSGWKRPVKENG